MNTTIFISSLFKVILLCIYSYKHESAAYNKFCNNAPKHALFNRKTFVTYYINFYIVDTFYKISEVNQFSTNLFGHFFLSF